MIQDERAYSVTPRSLLGSMKDSDSLRKRESPLSMRALSANRVEDYLGTAEHILQRLPAGVRMAGEDGRRGNPGVIVGQPTVAGL